MAWWTATSVTISTGTNIVTVNTGDDIAMIAAGDGLIIGNFAPVEVTKGYLDGGTKKIELKKNWTAATQTAQAAVAFPTDADLSTIAQALSNYLASYVVATQAQSETGADNVAAMTPLRVKQAIDFQRKEATGAEALAGTSQTGFMSPLRAMQLIQSSGLLKQYVDGAETDLNVIGNPRLTRFFYTTQDALNRPTADTTIYCGLQFAAQNSVCRQVLWAANTGIEKMYFRTGNGSPTMVWTAWREMLHTGNTVKQATEVDTTAGALLTVGSFGLGKVGSGTQFSALALSLDATTIPSGLYRVVNADTGTKPAGLTDYSLIHTRYNGTDSGQIAIGMGGTMHFRSSAGGVWNSWKKVNNDLVVQANTLDTTAGSLLTVSSFGLGGGAIHVADFKATELNVNRWGRFTTASVDRPSFMNAGAFITAQYDGTPTTYFMGAGLKTDNTTVAAFVGKRNAPAAVPTWYELWDKTQAPVQANKQDTTANAVLQNGAFELGSNYLQNQFNLAVGNGVWLALNEYVGGQTTLVNGWVYKLKILAVSTGVSTGTTYYLTQTAVGTWAARRAGNYAETGTNQPSLRIASNNLIELSHSGTGALSLSVWMEGWYTGNVTIQNPAWFGIDPFLRREFTNHQLEIDRLGTYYGIWDRKDRPAQSTRYDTTTGAMMQAGSFGWGTTAFGADGFGSNPAITDGNAITASGLYQMSSTWTGSPNAGTDGDNQGCLLHLTWSATYSVQMFFRMQTHNANHRIRFKDNGVWGPWVKILTTDTLSAPIQTSPYDTTAAALLRAGSFGLGTSNVTTVLADATALRVSGIYRVGTSWTGSVISGTDSNNQGVLVHWAWATNYGVQMFYNVQTKNHYVRHLNNGTWSAWDVQYNSSNVLNAVTYAGGQNTGGLMEYGTNANGAYYKYADGRLECFFSRNVAMTANTDDVYTWIFPHTFVTAPAYVTTNVTGASGSNGFKINKTTAASATTTQTTVRANVDYTQSHVLVYCAVGRWRS